MSDPIKRATLNQMGAMTITPDDCINKFMADVMQFKFNPILDIGCAFGEVSLKLIALQRNVTAIDLHSEHLQELREEAKKLKLLEYLTTIQGDFLQFSLPKNYFQAILCANVMHFYHGADILKGLAICKESLQIGGKIYLSGASPYVNPFKDRIDEFEQKQKKNEDWPGWINDVSQFSPDLLNDIPVGFHCLSTNMLLKACEQVGLSVLALHYYSALNDPTHALDGKEKIFLIAQK